jgi:hypothetical protein
MTLNDKRDCVESIVHALNRSSAWRTSLIVKFPNDPGNIRSAKMLEQLAVDAASMTAEQWSDLEPHFCWSSGLWRNALSDTARQVGFAHSQELQFLRERFGRCVVAVERCRVMVSLDTASVNKPKLDKNALALKKINDAWKGNSFEAARAAASDIGMLVAACMLAYDKAKDSVIRGFDVRQVDEKWSSCDNVI